MRGEDTKKFIIDASFILSFLLPDEEDKSVREVFDQYKLGEVDFLSPPILPFEVLNGLKSALRSKRIDRRIGTALLNKFSNIKIAYLDVDYAEVLDRALKKDLSIYDASYVWLAKEYDISLLTLDRNLSKIAAK